jgi:adenosylmethionine---8-amino-7-oxononanoate aminotransferase
MLACEHAQIEPDFLCLSKGLTSGWLPFSAVLTTDEIYNVFYDDHGSGKAFLHSNTFCGNALAASVALEVLNIFEEENVCVQAQQLGEKMLIAMNEVAISTKKLHNVRGIGAMVAADLICQNFNRRVGFEIYKKAVELGALLRPLGNTIYWLPPLNMKHETLEKLQQITKEAILAVDF